MIEEKIKEYLGTDDVVDIRSNQTIANDNMGNNESEMFAKEDSVESDIFELVTKDFINKTFNGYDRVGDNLSGIRSRFGLIVYANGNYPSFYIRKEDLNKIYKLI